MADSRLIRRAILDSERFNSLSWSAQNFFLRLLLVADDYGLYDARPVMLRSVLYPLALDKVSVSDVSSGLAACEEAGLVRRYSVEGKGYLQIVGYGQRQRTAAKYPLPPWQGENGGKLQQIAAGCSKLRQVAAGCGKLTPKTQTQTQTQCETQNARRGVATLPRLEEVKEYLRRLPLLALTPEERDECANHFFDGCEERGWVTRDGIPIRNWKASAKKHAEAWARQARAHPSSGGKGKRKWNISNAAPTSEEYKDL